MDRTWRKEKTTRKREWRARQTPENPEKNDLTANDAVSPKEQLTISEKPPEEQIFEETPSDAPVVEPSDNSDVGDDLDMDGDGIIDDDLEIIDENEDEYQPPRGINQWRRQLR